MPFQRSPLNHILLGAHRLCYIVGQLLDKYSQAMYIRRK